MKHSHLALFGAALFVAACLSPSFADSSVNVLASQTKTFPGTVTSATSGAQVAAAMADFGSPPSGEVPILFNDRHVYSKPDTLRQGRVLAALVKNGVLLVPLRSMFEQMGATVSYDGASKSVKATKPGSQVQVTLGKNEVLINGESRPLDVPPMMYKGSLLVPIRVISEALGAYVQWVPEQHLAVVRYIPPTPVPAPPTPVPTVAPTATPAPTPAPIGFIQGGVASTITYNEYADAAHSKGGPWVGEAGLFFGPWSVVAHGRSDQYPTTRNATSSTGAPLTQFNTIDGGTDFVPVFTARQWSVDGRLEYEILKPRINIAGSYLTIWTNYGNPRLTGGGAGLEKLPDPNSTFGWYGSAFYYPVMQGTYLVMSGPNNGRSFQQKFKIITYDIGLDFGAKNIYIIAGYSGDRYNVTQNAPINQTHSGPYAGLGIRF